MRSLLSSLACVAVLFGLALPASAIEPKYLPANAEFAVTINLKQILESPLLKDKKDLVDMAKGFIKDKLNESPAKEYLDKAGFDIFRDLHSITVTGDGSKDPDSFFIAIEGKFDTDKLVEVAKDAAQQAGDNLKVTKSGNVNVFEITPKENEKTIYAGLISDSLLVAAPTREALTATIARVNGGKSAALKPGLKKLIETTNAKQSFSFVATSEGLAKMAENAPQQNPGVGAALQTIEGMALSITLTKDIAFQLAGTATDADSAAEMAKKANGGIALAKLFIGQQAKNDEKLEMVVNVLDTLKISSQGQNVVLRGVVSQAVLEKAFSLIPGQ